MNSTSGTERVVSWGTAFRTEKGTLAFSTRIPSKVGPIHIDDEIPLAEAVKPGALGHASLYLETDPVKVAVNEPIDILGPPSDTL